MASQNECFPLTTNIEISNNKYIFNNNYQDISYGLYDTTETKYIINNIPKNYPVGFFIDNCNNTNYNDISNLIKYDSSINETIKIYVSRGNDISYNNGDYFRFYDESNNLINISRNHSLTSVDNNLINSLDNFYFMKGVSYEFIAAFDFSSSSPFELSSNLFTTNNDYSLNYLDASFIINIPQNSNNNNNSKITYYDSLNLTISGDLEILVDNSGINYYYNSIFLEVFPELSNNTLSIKSYPNINGISEINNINLFTYNDRCAYIIKGESEQKVLLEDQNSECLTQYSQAELSFNTANSSPIYYFNEKTHNSAISISDLKFGMYDGSYIIFNIRENYPIALKNIDNSNNIYIDPDYYYTKTYNKSGGIISNISGEEYKNYDFYYGAIKIIVNNTNNLRVNQSFNYLILDLSNTTSGTKYSVYDISNKLFYTTYCENIYDNFLSITNQVNFKLYNQNNEIFIEDNNNRENNIYKLNTFEVYEPITNNTIFQEFSANDSYGHDLTNLIDISLITHTIPHNTDYTEISNIQLIKDLTNDYENDSFIISYNLKYFDLTDNFRTRKVLINKGPIIEISNNDNIFKNQNPLTNIIEISTNTLINYFNYNFYKNIEVYVKDRSGNKLFLPFNVTLDGYYYNNDANYINAINKKTFINSSNIIDLNNSETELTINNLKHYVSNNLLTSKNEDQREDSIINLSNNTPIIIKNIEFINNFDELEDISFYNIIKNKLIIINNEQNEIRLTKIGINSKLNITDISKNSSDKYLISCIQDDTTSNLSINTIIEFTNESQDSSALFNIFIQEEDNSENNVTISGSFLRTNFFSNTDSSIDISLIDISYIGNYNINIDILGLNSDDYIYNTISNNLYSISYENYDLSKTYFIEVFDREAPNNIQFLNNTTSDTNYHYKHPKDTSFDIISDINITRLDTFNLTTLKPVIKYYENSIYTPTLSYDFINNTDVNVDFDVTNHKIFGKDGSGCSINLFLIDLCNNSSTTIRLDISFLDIPTLDLCGINPVSQEVNFDYIDKGFTIDSINIIDLNTISDSNIISTTISYDDFFNYNKQSIYNDISFDVSINGSLFNVKRSTNLDLAKFGTYDISYSVNKIGISDENIIIRKVKVEKNNRPYVFLYDLSNLSTLNNGIYEKAIDVSQGIFPTELSNALFTNKYTTGSTYSELSNNNLNLINNNLNLDFSFTYLSNFEDLSKILNAYDLCDNYFADTSLNVKITINLSGQEIIFKEISNNTTTYFDAINELSFKNVSYLTQDGSFDIVTISILNAKPQLDISYVITDPCNNIFSFSRIVNIVDITAPTISFNLIDNSFIIDYTNNNKDFSYQAYNYDVNNEGFLQEISNILFGFTLEDNYSNSEDIKNNYIITISGQQIKTIQEICGNNIIKDKFKNIDTSFTITYDFSDNQYNDASINRIINIINTIEPSLNVVSNTSTGSQGFINISFGDLSYNFLNDICLNHSRLNASDISFELSYNLPNYLTSISNLYEPSALIYQFQYSSNLRSIEDISFFNIAKNPGTGGSEISSNILKPSIIINIQRPQFYPSILSDINHEAGEYLSDASLLYGIHAYSIFDEFYYNSNSSLYSISYSETNFNISFDFSQFDLTLTDSSINHTITYSVIDQNNLITSLPRNLSVTDTKPPIFEGASGDICLNITSDPYIDDDLFINDIGSDLSALIITIKKRTGNNPWSNITITNNPDDVSFMIINLNDNNSKNYEYSGNILNFIDLNIETIIYQITYVAYDKFDNSSSFERVIRINSTNNIILTPKIFIRNNETSSSITSSITSSISFNLISDFSYNNSIIDIRFDNSTKTLFYEATSDETFTNNISFDLDATFNSIDARKLDPIYSHIIANEVNNYNIIFQAFTINNGNLYTNNSTINFNVIDTTPPTLSFLNIQNDSLELPLLSDTIINKLDQSLNYFNKYYDNNIQFLKNDNDDIIFSINGIIIEDIAHNEPIISLSNDTLEDNSLYNMNVTYSDLSNETFFDNSFILTTSGDYIQTYRVTDNYNNDTSINRIIRIKKFPPFMQFNYTNYKFIDALQNIYKKEYHKIYNEYTFLDVSGFDYYELDSSLNIRTPNTTDIDINNSNNYLLQYTIDNSYSELSSNLIHNVEVVNMETLVDKTINEIIEKYNNNIKFGIYINQNQNQEINFNIIVENSNNAIRLKKFSEVYNDFSNIMIRSNSYNNDLSFNIRFNELITLTSDLSFINESNQETFYYGNVILTIKDNFNRASIKYLENGLENELNDIILFNEDFETINVNDIFDNLNITNIESYIVKTGYINNENQNLDSQDNSSNKVFKIKKINDMGNNINLKNLEDISSGFINNRNFYLSFGKYRFYQGHHSNFYNQIKFSYLPDGHHYNYNDLSAHIKNDLGLLSLNDISSLSFSGKLDPSFNTYSYTKNINNVGLPGFKSRFNNDISVNENFHFGYPYTEIIIDATTPNPLYYYSENFANMGGKIEIKNNITITNSNSNNSSTSSSNNKANILLNGNILSIDNSNINYSNNIFNDLNFNDNSNNRIFLSQHFDLSINGNIIANKSFIGITQQNINHNMIFNKDGKIIFKKYEDVSTNNNEELAIVKDISNYSIKYNNNNNYLYDSSVNKFRSNLLFFDFTIDTSLGINNFINQQQQNSRYLVNLNNIYFNNGEINNYYNFLKTNKINNQRLTGDNFKNKISEITYINKINIKDGNDDYQYFQNDYLKSNKIYFQPIFDNQINLSIQSYLDIEKLNLTSDYRNYLKNNVFNRGEIITNYINQIDFSNLFLQEYIFSLYSDVCGNFEFQDEISSVGLIFNNGTLELNNFLLDSSFSNNIIDKLFYDISNQTISKDTINNRIFLSIKDVDNCNNLIFNGLTQQNIYHNMYLDDENKFIIHRYNPSSVNAFVTNKNSNLLNNILELTNNNRYFLELSNNDPYNCFIDSNNLYDNNIEKNNFFKEASNNSIREYKSKISYSIIDELPIDNEYITNKEYFDLRPKTLNNISYNKHPNAYDTILQNLHSHSYIINLRNHIDRNFYNNDQLKTVIPYNIIDYDKLYYVIRDISYDSLHEFNLFDLGNNQKIIYDKTKIDLLKSLQSKIFIVNLKIKYLLEYYDKTSSIDTQPLTLPFVDITNNDLTNLDNQLIYNNNFDNLVRLYSDISFINDNYNLDIGTRSLNDLFSYAYFNTNILLQYYEIFRNYENFFNVTYDIIPNIYTNILNFDNIDQLNNDVNSVDILIDNIFTNKFLIDEQKRFNNISIIGISFEIFNELHTLFNDFNTLREKYEKINFELTLRDDDKFIDNTRLLTNNNIQNLVYHNLYASNITSIFYENLVNNYITLFKFLQFDICNSNLEMNFVTGHNWKITDNSKNFTTNTGITAGIDLSNIYNNLKLDITNLYNDISYLVYNSNGSNDISFSDISWINVHDNSFNFALNHIIDNNIQEQGSFRTDYKIYIQIDNSFVSVNEDEDINLSLNSFDICVNNYYNYNNLNPGKLNRYLYNYSLNGQNFYLNELPAWNNFGSSTLVTDVADSFNHTGLYFTYFYDGYIYTTTPKTLYFDINANTGLDIYLWIIEGDRKWSTIDLSNDIYYTYITENIEDVTLVCSSIGNNIGQYTFQANTLYSILIKYTEATSGQSFKLKISETQINEGDTIDNSDFPSYFIPDLDFNNKANIQFFEQQKNNLNTILDNYIDSINFYYDYLQKTVENTKINYIMNGNSLLVNSVKSNNILIKFDLYYNSFLYRNTYLDTFVLDMAIPDYTPPTLIFNTENLEIELANSNQNNVDTIIEKLLEDISYIDINQENNENLETDLSINNIIFQYIDYNNNEISKNIVGKNIFNINIFNINGGKLNRYFYDHSLNSTEYTNSLPAWSNFGNAILVSDVSNSFNYYENYFTYFYDGYIHTTTPKTLYFGIASDDDSFLWIIEGDRKWSTIDLSNDIYYTYITENIEDASLVCYESDKSKIKSNYTANNIGNYTFKPYAPYSILIKYTEATGGQSFKLKISETQINEGDTIDNSDFPPYFLSDLSDLHYIAPTIISLDITTLIRGYVTYTIKDYANNENIIRRSITILSNFELPDMYYINNNNENKITNIDRSFINFPDDKNLIISDNDDSESIINKAKNNIIIVDVQVNPSEFYTKEDPEFNQLLNININNYENGEQYIIYTLTSSSKIGTINNVRTINRNINIIKEDGTIVKPTHCCYPKVYYKAIQHNYKLGSQGSSRMRLAKIIINS